MRERKERPSLSLKESNSYADHARALVIDRAQGTWRWQLSSSSVLSFARYRVAVARVIGGMHQLVVLLKSLLSTFFISNIPLITESLNHIISLKLYIVFKNKSDR